MTLLHAVAHPAVPESEADRLLPTLIALHGHGAHAQDLLGLGPILAHGRLLMICPQAEFAIEPGYPGYTWFRRGGGDQRAPGELERVSGLLAGFLDEVERRLADCDAVVVMRYIRTLLGKHVRTLCGKRDVPWRFCWSGGQGGITESVIAAAGAARAHDRSRGSHSG